MWGGTQGDYRTVSLRDGQLHVIWQLLFVRGIDRTTLPDTFNMRQRSFHISSVQIASIDIWLREFDELEEVAIIVQQMTAPARWWDGTCVLEYYAVQNSQNLSATGNTRVNTPVVQKGVSYIQNITLTLESLNNPRTCLGVILMWVVTSGKRHVCIAYSRGMQLRRKGIVGHVAQGPYLLLNLEANGAFFRCTYHVSFVMLFSVSFKSITSVRRIYLTSPRGFCSWVG